MSAAGALIAMATESSCASPKCDLLLNQVNALCAAFALSTGVNLVV